MNKIKTILLTGSGGFVGKNLKEFFEDKYKILCPRSFELDLTDTSAVDEFFKSHKIDFIIHCATKGGARGIKDPEFCEQDNILMVKNLLKAKDKNIKILLFGSGAAYDKTRDIKKVKESQIGEIIPKDAYGLSKMKIAQLAEQRNDIICLNIFACYGKYEKYSRFPTYAIMQNLKKEPVVINQNVIFDYLYIDDLCYIVEKFINKAPISKVINVTPTRSLSLLEITQTVNNICGYESEIILKQDGMNFEYTGDNTCLLAEIPDLKFTPIEYGIKELSSFISRKEDFSRFK